MKLIFPYGIRFLDNGQMDIFPAVDLLVLGRGDKGIRALFHLDSGATISILPISDAAALAISLNKEKKVLVRGIVHGTLIGYSHNIQIQLASVRLKIPAIFVISDLAPRILGREGIFNRFAIFFDELKRRTLFLDARKDRKIIDSLFL